MTRCEDCKFYVPNDEELYHPDYGECRRFAPQTFTGTREITGSPFNVDKQYVTTTSTGHPETKKDHWCGEFQPRQNSPEPDNPIHSTNNPNSHSDN